MFRILQNLKLPSINAGQSLRLFSPAQLLLMEERFFRKTVHHPGLQSHCFLLYIFLEILMGPEVESKGTSQILRIQIFRDSKWKFSSFNIGKGDSTISLYNLSPLLWLLLISNTVETRCGSPSVPKTSLADTRIRESEDRSKATAEVSVRLKD